MRLRTLSCLAIVVLTAIGCQDAPSTSPATAAPAKTPAASKSEQSPTGLAIGLGAAKGDLSAAGGPTAYDPNPVAPEDRNTEAVSNFHGTLSVENFQGTAPNLAYTHESAAGWRAYLNTWYTPNYVYLDNYVGLWQFHDNPTDNLDKWNNGGVDYGIDAVLACWHSSHGVMDAAGTYQTLMGSNWSAKGWRATSTAMCLGGNLGVVGTERLRYMWFDTCFSARISNNRDPWKTWGARAKGLRMLFGYETTSVDNPNYGKFFWEEWNKNKTFSMAFLDASWRISHGQVPVAVAFGSTQADAIYRRDVERQLSSVAVTANSAAWIWYNAGSSAPKPPISVPPDAAAQNAVPKANTEELVQVLARSMGIDMQGGAVENHAYGIRMVRSKGATLAIERDGDFELALEKPAPQAGGAPVADADLVRRARSIVDQFGLAGGSQYAEGAIRTLNEADGSDQGTSAPKQREKTVVLDQIVDGLPFIDADAGHVEITFDAASGAALRVKSTVRPLMAAAASRRVATRSLDDLRQSAIKMTTPPPVPGGATPAAREIIADSEEVGYVMIDQAAVPVYRALVRDPSFPDGRPTEVTIPLAKRS